MNQKKVITFGNADYVKLAPIWKRELEKTGVHDYVVIATDKIAYAKLVEQGLNAKLIKQDGKFNFARRLNVIRQYLEAGVDVVHSDLDAIWKRNILPHLNDPEVDLYISQGTTHPREHFEKHGFVLCCGFYYAKSNEGVLNFFEALVKLIDEQKEHDDQRALNHLLLADTEWHLDGAEKQFKGSVGWYHSSVTGYNKKFNLQLCLISMLKVQRLYLNRSGYIYHILTAKNIRSKIHELARHDIIETTLIDSVMFRIRKWAANFKKSSFIKGNRPR